MKRTQIYLPEQTHQTLFRLAKKRKVSFAQIVRACIEREMGRMDTDYSGRKTMQAITRLGIRGGPKDLSANLDQYLYGKKGQ